MEKENNKSNPAINKFRSSSRISEASVSLQYLQQAIVLELRRFVSKFSQVH